MEKVGKLVSQFMSATNRKTSARDSAVPSGTGADSPHSVTPQRPSTAPARTSIEAGVPSQGGRDVAQHANSATPAGVLGAASTQGGTPVAPLVPKRIKFTDEDARHYRRRPARPTDFMLVKGILAKALARNGLEKKVERYAFVLHWSEIVGEGFDIVCKPECLSRNTLIVRVINSGWAQELGFQKSVILERLARFLPPGDRVNEVAFRVGPLL